MAYLDDLSDEDRRQLEESGGGGGAPSGPAPSPGGGGATPGAAPSSGFQNLSNYFTANEDTAKAQGAATAADLEKQAVGDIFSNDPGHAMETYGEIDAAATPGGLATVNQGDRSGGESLLDSYLSTKGADPGRFEGLRNTFGDALKNVETDPGAANVRDPWKAFDSPQAQTDWEVQHVGDTYRDLELKAMRDAEAADQARYEREMQPYRDYTERTRANREPFDELWRLYYGNQGNQRPDGAGNERPDGSGTDRRRNRQGGAS